MTENTNGNTKFSNSKKSFPRQKKLPVLPVRVFGGAIRVILCSNDTICHPSAYILVPNIARSTSQMIKEYFLHDTSGLYESLQKAAADFEKSFMLLPEAVGYSKNTYRRINPDDGEPHITADEDEQEEGETRIA